MKLQITLIVSTPSWDAGVPRGEAGLQGTRAEAHTPGKEQGKAHGVDPRPELTPVATHRAFLPVDHSHIHKEIIQRRQKGHRQKHPKGMGGVTEEPGEYKNFPSEVKKGGHTYVNSQEEEEP